jgi:signal transduction histidine kinase
LLGPEESATAAPMPTTADLPKLVQEFRDAGLDATLSMEGDAGSLAPAAGLNLYRIVQESLTNVAKHAPRAKATVRLDVTASDIKLVVHNELNGSRTPRSRDGLGLRGMAERAANLGGALQTDDSDGWTVSVVAPRQTA